MKLKLLTLINIEMKKTFLIIAGLFVAITTVMVSCDSTKSSKFEGFEETEDGLIYKFHTRGEGTVFADTNDFVTLDMIYATEDTVIFDSKTLPQVMKLPIIEATYQGDIYSGLRMMKVGDSVTFVCPADSVFLKLFRMPMVPPQFDSIDYIYFHVKLNNIETEAEVKAAQEAELKRLETEETMKRYEFLEKNYPDAQELASGLYYIEVKEGKGDTPQNGQNVNVHYTGTFLDGNKFDSSVDRGNPLSFVLGQKRVIPGWEEGVAMMREGGKAVLVVPSHLAYGPQGRSSIPPYSTLVFEIELLSIDK